MSPITQALDAARLALDFVRPAEATVTARVNEQLAHTSIANLERALAFCNFEKARQERVTAARADRAQVDQALAKPAATPATSAKRSK